MDTFRFLTKCLVDFPFSRGQALRHQFPRGQALGHPFPPGQALGHPFPHGQALGHIFFWPVRVLQKL